MARQSQPRKNVGRKNIKMFKTVEEQGRGSYVKFHVPTWGETRETSTSLRVHMRDYAATPRGGEKRLDIVEEAEDHLTVFLWELVVDKFHSWNWVDDDGYELPPPISDYPDGVDTENLDEDWVDEREGTRSFDLLGPEIKKLFAIIQSLYLVTEMEDGELGN